MKKAAKDFGIYSLKDSTEKTAALRASQPFRLNGITMKNMCLK